MSSTSQQKDSSGNDDEWSSEHEFELRNKFVNVESDVLQLNTNNKSIYNTSMMSRQFPPPRTSSSKTNKFKKMVGFEDSSITTTFLENGCVRVIFHVHFPSGIEEVSRNKFVDKATPCVIGNISELGNWENAIVPLKQPYSKSFGFYGKSSTYWVSEPVMIPIEKFNSQEIKYRYAMQVIEKIDKKGIKAEEKRIKDAEKKAEKERKDAEKKAEKERKDAEKKAERERKDAEKKAERERKDAEKKAEKERKDTDKNKKSGGENDITKIERLNKKLMEEPKINWFQEIIYDTQDYRILNIKGLPNQFDMVNQINIYNRRYNKPTHVHDYEFFKIIWKSFSPENAKKKLIEYLDILEKFTEDTLLASDVNFIGDAFQKTKDKDKHLFLTIILGYYIMTRSNSLGNYNILNKKFPSQNLFECIEKFQPQDWLSNTQEMLLTALRASIVHNVRYGHYYWVKPMFTLADLLDPDYSFLECISNQRFDEKYSESLVYVHFPKYVIPNINKLESDEKYSRIAKWMIMICCNIDQLLKVWSSSIEHTISRDILLRDTFLEQVQFHISNVSAELLRNHFDAISDDFKAEVAEPFRRATFNLLENTSVHKWTIYNADAISDILINDRLEW
ncbi:1896_t:CDS:2, partial [Scutellospora calospora]